MVSLLVVDDEPLIREGLCGGFNWAGMGYMINGAVSDGIEAIEQINKNCPDVIITDVAMPRMDGLALLGYITENNLPIETVLLSGHDKFDYVQKALQYGAHSYILKPIDHKQFRTMVISLKQSIQIKRREEQKKLDMERMLTLSENIILRRKLQQYLSGRTSFKMPSALIEKSFGEEYMAAKYIIVAFQYKAAAQAKLMREQFVRWIDRQKCLSGLLLANDISDMFLLCENGEIGIFQFLTSFCMKNGVTEPEKIRCLYSSTAVSLMQLPSIYQKTMNEIENSFYYRFGCVSSLRLENDKTEKLLSSEKIKNIAETVTTLICENNIKRIPACLEELYCHYANSMMPKTLTIVRFCNFYNELVHKAKSINQNIEELSLDGLYTQLENTDCYYDLTKMLTQKIMYLTKQTAITSIKNEQIISRICRYIDSHFQENLSLEDLGTRFYFTSAYLSTLFSQKMGVSLSAYIKSVRLNEAKRLLEKEISIADVARMAGYRQYRYFCTVFKAQTGLTPRQYRCKIACECNQTKLT